MKYTSTPSRAALFLVAGLFLSALLAACGAGSSATPTPAATLTPVPVYVYVQPTVPPVFASAAAADGAAAQGTAAATPDTGLIALGKSRYDALQCGSCHGDAGQGTDKGKALAGTTLTHDAFVTFVRTGGTVGSSHLFASNRLSDTGLDNLYLYVVSLSSQGSATQPASTGAATQASTQQP